MPRILDYERHIGPDSERQQMEMDAKAGKISISNGSEFMVIDGSGNITDFYYWCSSDNTWNH
jgi:hypothetical protein